MRNKIYKYWYKIVGITVEDSIYMKTLSLGYNSGDSGISFNTVIEKLNIDISNEDFEFNFALWFYSNFYNSYFERKILGLSTATNSDYYLNKRSYKELKINNSTSSYIKGDSLNKYIDFLELQRTRKASRNATIISLLSMFIAIFSIIIPRIYQEDSKQTEYSKESINSNKSTEHESKNSIKFESNSKEVNNSKTENYLDTLN
jgi:hypothetical protein